MDNIDATSYKNLLEKIAETYLVPGPAQRVDALLRTHIRDRILPWVQGPEILEMGAAELMWTGEIISHFGHSSIVDGATALLENARAVHGDKVTCYESFFEEFTLPGHVRFQTVLATHVMEHVYEPVKVLTRSREWLAPGGRMIVVVPNATSLHRRIGVKMGVLQSVYDFSERDHILGHQRVYDLETLQAHALEAGYRIVHTQGFFLKIVSNAQMADFSDALIRALFSTADELPAEMSSDIGLVLEAAG
jgi:SAM-dependent methyltransferase